MGGSTSQKNIHGQKGFIAFILRHKVLFGVLALLIFEICIAFGVHPDMSKVAEEPEKLKHIFGFAIPLGGINTKTIIMSWIIMGILVVFSFFATRRMKKVPGKLQLIAELIVGGFDDLCNETLGDKARKFLPLVATIFLFVLLSNIIGIIPIPGIEEPTRDLNTTLGLGIMVFLVSHIAGIRYRGIKKYVAEYFEPMIEIKGVRIPNLFMFFLNFVGEIGKVVSHSFRLFGNIMGGAIIIVVVSNLVRYVLLPIGLNIFFGIFVGLVQAFVFAMLALTYISMMVTE
ncbi:MAG: F0F1 ATP synthase subunit A [Candidatus Theseobacter exili]|nr:F0F1 ATP synthase subunit A [Candidatus Theseobacter exili]